MLVAFVAPRLSLICAALILYLRPEGSPLHKSMTTSPLGCEQQTRTLPSAGLSSGSGS
jgi:hypothetical protein